MMAILFTNNIQKALNDGNYDDMFDNGTALKPADYLVADINAYKVLSILFF